MKIICKKKQLITVYSADFYISLSNIDKKAETYIFTNQHAKFN